MGLKDIGSKKWLLIILSFGLIIRLVAAWIQPLDTDEAFNYFLCRAGWNTLIQVMIADNHTPALHLLLWPLMQVTHSPLLLRLPSVLIGALSVILAFHLFRLLFSERESLLLTAIVACGYRLIINDAMIRPYGLMTAGLLAIWLGLNDIRRDGHPFSTFNIPARASWFVYGLIALLTASLHLLGVIMVVLASVVMYSFLSKAKLYTAIAHIIAVIPGISWYLYRMLSRPTGNHVNAFSWDSLERLPLLPLCVLNLKLGDRAMENCGKFDNYFTNLGIDLWSALLSIEYPSYYCIALFALGALLWLVAAWGVFRLWKLCSWQALFCTTMVFIPLAGFTLGVMLGYVNFLSERYFIPFTVPFLMLLTAALKDKAIHFQRGCLIVSLLVCLVFPWSPALWVENWNNTFSFIEANRAQGDIIMLYLPNPVYSFALAYDGDNVQLNGEPRQRFHKSDKLPWFMLVSGVIDDRMLEVVRKHRVFLIVSTLDNPSFDPQALRWFNDNCHREGCCWDANINSWATHATLLYRAK